MSPRRIADGYRLRPRSCQGEDGIALLTVLWVLLLLSAMAATLVAITRTESGVVRNTVDNARAASMADAAVHHAIFDLLDTQSDNERRTDGTAARLDFGGAEIWVSIQDENGKVDINRGDDTLLRGLFKEVGVDDLFADQLVDRIADFRDPDSLVRLHGAEKQEYESRGLSHGPKDAPFNAIEELQQVVGMTPEIFRKVAPFITVHAQQRGIDPATAPEVVLRAAPNLGTAAVDAVLVERAETNNTAQPLSSLATAQRRAGSAGTRGVYTIRATAVLESKATFVREATVWLQGRAERPYQILRWKQSFERRPSDIVEVLE